MIILPAIDIQNGKVVRLQKGDFTSTTVYGNNPLEVAKKFENQGATWLHVIDLDGAETGISKNIAANATIKPTMIPTVKKLPMKLKSFLLVSAYADKPRNIAPVSPNALVTI